MKCDAVNRWSTGSNVQFLVKHRGIHQVWVTSRACTRCGIISKTTPKQALNRSNCRIFFFFFFLNAFTLSVTGSSNNIGSSQWPKAARILTWPAWHIACIVRPCSLLRFALTKGNLRSTPRCLTLSLVFIRSLVALCAKRDEGISHRGENRAATALFFDPRNEIEIALDRYQRKYTREKKISEWMRWISNGFIQRDGYCTMYNNKSNLINVEI